MTSAPQIVEVDTVDCDFEPKPWGFAAERAAEIDVHWRDALRCKPKMFDGPVLLLHRGEMEHDPVRGAVFRGAYLKTQFAALLAWREFGWPPAGVRNGSGMAALRSADGAYLLGEMAPHTANAGRIYFASGTPDPTDIVGGKVDIEGSVRRELAEETGLDPQTLDFDDGMTLVIDPVRIGFMKRVRSSEPAEALVDRIHAFLARQPEPELVRMHVVRSPEDIGPSVPVLCAAYLRAMLSRPIGSGGRWKAAVRT